MKGFWAGLAIGLVTAGAVGLYAVNFSVRGCYINQTLNGANRLDHLNALRAKLEAGEAEQADAFHRAVAWANVREARYYECMGKSAWILISVLNSGPDSPCETELRKRIDVPDNFEIPGLEQDRQEFARQQATRQNETSP